ncbi:MAG: GNAT family N-acetyltransferase [Gammaproteobacteria bacterium]
MSQIEVEIRSGLEGLESMAMEWPALTGSAENAGFEHSHGAFLAALKYRLADPSVTRCAVLRRGPGSVVGICPLVPVRRRIRRLGFPAWDLPRDPDRPTSSFVLAGIPPDGALGALQGILSRDAPGPCLLSLPRVEQGSPTWRLLRQAPAESLFSMPSGSAIRIPTVEDAGSRIAGLSQKFRQNLRRGWRMLEEAGKPVYRVAREVGEVGEALERFLGLEAAGWKGSSAQGHAIRSDPALLAYVRGTTGLLAARSQCHVHELRAGDRLVASLICFLGSGEAYAFKIAHDESLRRAAPGHLLLQRVLEDYGRAPAVRALAGGPEAGWWSPWRPEVTPLHAVYVGLGGVKSRLALALLRAGRQGSAQ